MADTEKVTPKSNSGAPPESPTTARPLDFDDDPQDAPSGAATADVQNSSAPQTDDTPLQNPPRPLSPRMTDPDSQKEPEPPAKPPRPTVPTSTTRSQLEADELYARQLAEHYSGASRRAPQQRQSRPPYDEEDREHSFFDDDLPVIRENLRKGFLETQSTVNKWVQNFKKRIDGEDLDDLNSQQSEPSQGYQSRGGAATYGRRSGDTTRRSADRDRYDADPQVLPDDFSTLELRDAEAPPPRPARPLANPDLFKPTPSTPSGRKVSFQDGPHDDVPSDMYSTDTPKRTTSAGKTSKWQPLSAVDPSPVADNDPFSLGDSDDDKETKKDPSSDEAERLQKATTEAMEGGVGGKDEAPKSNKT
ncbi:putative cue domain [Phaeomoniella chlamydospora]|uniref:Putative cue domain n=1 Tax=Phaeomoniella chlamydospora TaxID=158046 RepID=A0A0G2EZW1_PHACM|nr:putative cue domain [Phaeomoniella chlamydospora]